MRISSRYALLCLCVADTFDTSQYKDSFIDPTNQDLIIVLEWAQGLLFLIHLFLSCKISLHILRGGPKKASPQGAKGQQRFQRATGTHCHPSNRTLIPRTRSTRGVVVGFGDRCNSIAVLCSTTNTSN